jgi:hypothetical protein
MFDKKYLTGSYREQDLSTSNAPSRRISPGTTRHLEGGLRPKPNSPQPSIVINDRGRNVPNKLDFLDTSQDVSKTKGSLELHTPTTKPEITTRRRQSMQQDIIPPSAQRKTRSKTALSKNLPYTPVKEGLTCRILEYPINAVKNKITIFNDDIDRLNDDEFLNDTIIEFYLRYSYQFIGLRIDMCLIIFPLKSKE